MYLKDTAFPPEANRYRPATVSITTLTYYQSTSFIKPCLHTLRTLVPWTIPAATMATHFVLAICIHVRMQTVSPRIRPIITETASPVPVKTVMGAISVTAKRLGLVRDGAGNITAHNILSTAVNGRVFTVIDATWAVSPTAMDVPSWVAHRKDMRWVGTENDSEARRTEWYLNVLGEY